MKYRTRISEDICSLEELFTEHLGLSIPIVPQTSTYSNRHTFNKLFFSQNIDPSMNLDEILQLSVFKDTELDRLKSEALSTKNPIYFIINPDESFPTGSKLSVLFSNMIKKNYTGNSQQPAIRELLNSIDYRKLCKRIDILIKNKCDTAPEFSTKIEAYIHNILSGDSMLAEHCSTLKCSSPDEYIAVFLLYALFDEQNFQLYVRENKVVDELRHTSNGITANIDNSHLQKLTSELRSTDIYQRCISYVLVIAYAVQMLLAIISYVYSDPRSDTSMENIMFNVILLCVTIILTALRFIPFAMQKKYAQLSLILEHSIFERTNELYSVSLNRFQNCSHTLEHIRRSRRNIILIFCSLSVCYVAISFVLNSFPILVALVAATFAVVLFLDNFMHDIVSYKKYDGYYNNSKTDGHQPTARHGLARICRWDYDYREHDFRHNDINRLSNYSEDCIRHIYNQVADTCQFSWQLLTAFIMILSSVGVLAQVMQLAFPDVKYFHIPNQSMMYSIIMILILVNGILNILILLRSENHYQKLAQFSYYAGSTNMSSEEFVRLFRHNIYSGNISDIDIARGIYNYNFCMYEKGIPADKLQPVDDRYHLSYIMLQKMHLITAIFICILITYFSIAVWNMNCLRNLILAPVLISAYLIFTFLIYPFRMRSLVRKDIEEIHNAEKGQQP